ncbi:hypothetical protein [Planomicrobium sp. CPCC 101110]|uniref:hypothetical protein n=1 Tax=Planomicrobium sp. CPCC 101110 TaxID=2599619 RepID=UPI0011B79749|nr:hypothetical protein [Planomicrobium sp. CPCC 101110]TWT26030.1 hypothetical protein FQV30_09575 [Planomicrobium sp. CPCC 101110]
MEISFNDFLVGDGYSYIFKSGKRGKVNFYFFIDPEEEDLDKSYSQFLKEFLKRLDRYPIYLHGISSLKDINIADGAKISKVMPRNYHYLVEITNLEELLSYFPKAYLDAYNNASIFFSTEQTIEMDLASDIGLARFILDFTISTSKDRYYLWIGHDAIGFDFVSNFSHYPYNEVPITREED